MRTSTMYLVVSAVLLVNGGIAMDKGLANTGSALVIIAIIGFGIAGFERVNSKD